MCPLSARTQAARDHSSSLPPQSSEQLLTTVKRRGELKGSSLLITCSGAILPMRKRHEGDLLLESRALKNPLPAQRGWSEISRIFRAHEWWEFKLSPMLATAYATAFLLKISILSLWPMLLLALFAWAVCAAYVSVINDLTDLEDDLASGKVNRLVGKSRLFGAAVLACCIVPGAAVAVYWHDDPLLLAPSLACWV